MAFVTDLPREAEDLKWRILAPVGGYGPAIDQVLDAAITQRVIPIDLDLFLERIVPDGSHQDLMARLRLYPDITVLSRDPSRPTVYHFLMASGVFVDKDGAEADTTVNVTAYVNIEVTAQGTTCGDLTMWNLSDEAFRQLLKE